MYFSRCDFVSPVRQPARQSTHSVLPVLPVTVVSLREHDRLGTLETILWEDKADDITQPGVRLLVRVGDTHTTTDSDIVADDLLAL